VWQSVHPVWVRKAVLSSRSRAVATMAMEASSGIGLACPAAGQGVADAQAASKMGKRVRGQADLFRTSSRSGRPRGVR